MHVDVGVRADVCQSQDITYLLVLALKATLVRCGHNWCFSSIHCTCLLSVCTLQPFCHSCMDAVSTQASVYINNHLIQLTGCSGATPETCTVDVATVKTHGKLNVDTQ